MLSHHDIREEMIRQLDGEKIRPKDVQDTLKIPSARVAEMRRRARRVQHEELEPLAALLGISEAKAPPVTSTADTGDTVSIQKLDLSLSMGPGTLIDDYVEAEPVAFDLKFIQSITRSPSNRLRLVTGIGDSMFPTLSWGDAIMIDTTDRALSRQDGIYWIDLYGAAGIKRLRTVGKGRVLVKSDNPTVEDQEVDAGELRIEGRAIWVARGL